MAVYKVIQDIEAEDKLLGPLGLKGLVYAGITATLGFINLRLLESGMGPLKWLVVFALLLPMILFGVVASPLGGDQPTEVWLLSRIRFFLKPHLRVWDQSGIKQLVTITAPKKEIKQLTKGFSQDEVNSRLQALALTLDSRGWAVKNVTVNLNDSAALNYQSDSDRLIETSDVAKEAPEIDVQAADDILDENNNPTAQKFKTCMDKADIDRRQALRTKLTAAKSSQPIKEEAFLERHPHPEQIHDLRRSQSLEEKAASEPSKNRWEKPSNRVTAGSQAAKLELAQSGNVLSVASIAKLANRDSENSEVVIALHRQTKSNPQGGTINERGSDKQI
jgi:hypothetical protein